MAFMKACSLLEVNQAFTSYSNPKGHADTDTKSAKQRVMRTLKEGLVHIREWWKSQGELIEALECWIRFYNEEYLHSSLGYKPPTVFASPTSCENEWEGEEMCQPAMG